eukprot:TRINITY_DN53183_c0_g1_i1.p2 TRINITY_DN53183_c0_g1~~TRINITY_DN53183_c0_g1_i1.p2  ORF type:complete len:113 (+),score=20.63 TRINITY_DN53183_c0_g1_i1:1-339(+)
MDKKLAKFKALREAITKERTMIEMRLREINDALGASSTSASEAGNVREKTRSKKTTPKKRGKRKMSAEARAKIAAAQKKRWAKAKNAKRKKSNQRERQQSILLFPSTRSFAE